LINDSNLELTDLRNYINQMGQDGAWAGHPKIYAAAWCYKVDITIYSKDYAAMGGHWSSIQPGRQMRLQATRQ
jgi:hypothetical protein